LLLREFTHNVNNRKIMGNIALNKTATASSFVMPYTPAKAVNGTITPFSRWLCDKLPGWMEVDLGSLYLVNRVVIRHMPVAGWLNPNHSNCDFQLQASNDNINWNNIYSVTNNLQSIFDRTFNTILFRFFRVYVTKGLLTNTQLASIVELELYQAYSCQLTNLAINSGTLTPVFNTNTYVYTATVTTDVASINVTPTAFSPTAFVTVNGRPVISGHPSPVALNFGSNTITVNVTDGGAVQNYAITVTRPGSNLSTLTVQSPAGNIPLIPAFVSVTQTYTASVANSVTGVTFTPTAQKSTAIITINSNTVASGQVSQSFPLAIGANTFTIQVTSDGVNFSYTVTITRAGSSVNLLLDHALVNYSGRGIVSGSVNVPMNDTQTDYPVTVLTGSTAVSVSPFAKDLAAVIKVNNIIIPSGQTSGSVLLNASGSTAVPIVVSSPDGSSSLTYTLNVSKGSIQY
jgi:hypothetical protein